MPRITRVFRSRSVAVVLGFAVLLASLVGLAACGTGATSSAAKPVATATSTSKLDPQLQSYYNVLAKYYEPLGEDVVRDEVWGYHNIQKVFDPQKILPAMLSQRPAEARIISEAQALRDHLTATPPAQLQMDDTYLRQAAKASVVIYTKLVALIDAQDTQGFASTYKIEGVGNQAQYCTPVNDINSQLVSAGLPVTDVLTALGVPCNQYGAPTPTP